MKLFHIALSLLVLTPVTAFAQEVATSVTVSYGDLNLRTESGVKVLDRRLTSAIRSICSVYSGSAVLANRFAAQRCMGEKIAEVAPLRNRAIASHSSPEMVASR